MSYRTQQRDGHETHFSVGALIKRGNTWLLIDRVKPPFGLAGVAGHVDAGEEPEEAIKREITEESGLEVISAELVGEEYLDWNECSKGVAGHYWYVYDCATRGEVASDKAEVKAFDWYRTDQLKELKLEPAWEHWFKKLGLL